MGVVRKGLASGIDVKQITKDLEEHINGTFVRGSWGPALQKPPKAYTDIYDGLIAGNMKPQQAGKLAREQYYNETGKRLTEQNNAYIKRLSGAGRDYRAIRITRTNMWTEYNNAQAEAVRSNNPAVDDGKAEIVLVKSRDSWNCHCDDYAEKVKGGKYLGPDNYFYHDREHTKPVLYDGEPIGTPPYHPNCMCVISPILLTNDEMMEKIMKEMETDTDGVGVGGKPDVKIDEPVGSGAAGGIGGKKPDVDIPKQSILTKEIKKPDYKPVDAQIKREFQDASNQIYATATQGQKDALRGYTGSNFVEMNKMLYGNNSYKNKANEKLVKDLDNIVKEYKLNKDIVSHRGTDAKFYADWEAGKSYNLPAFVSTSIDKNNEIVLGGELRIEMRIKKGTTGMYIGDLSKHKTEEEFLLGRNLKYTVLERNKNTIVVEVSND